MHALIKDHQQQIVELCRRYGVQRFDVFGSILRDDFDLNSSDVDVVVEFDANASGSGLNRYFDLKEELEKLLQRPVDLVELSAMPNTRLKRLIERSKMRVYAAST